jgi:AsmA protein
MLRLVKWLFGVVFGFLALVVLGVVAITVFIDPNDFKLDIEAAANEQGISLTLGGDLSWQFYPDLGIVVHQIALAPLSDAKNNIASIEEAALSVKLMPLFKGEVAVNGVFISGLNAKLSVDREGKGNWEKLLGEPAAVSPSTTSDTESSEFSLAVHQVTVKSSQVYYYDEQANQTISLKDFAFQGVDIALDGKPFVIETSGEFVLQTAEDKQSGHFSVQGGIAVDKEITQFSMSDGAIALDIASAEKQQDIKGHLQLAVKLPGEQQPLYIDNVEFSDADINLNDLATKQKLTIRDFVLSVKNASLNAENFPFMAKGVIHVEQPDMPALSTAFEFSSQVAVDEAVNAITMRDAKLMASLTGEAAQKVDLQWTMQLSLEPFSYDGDVRLAPVNARKALAVIGETLPATQSPNAFSKVGFNAVVSGNDNAFKAKDLTLILDESTFKGSVAVTDIEKQALVVKLKGDVLNADNYLEPVTEATKPGAVVESTGDEILIPLEDLRALNMDVDLVLESFTLNKLLFKQLTIAINAHDGLVKINQFSGFIYDSPMQLVSVIDAKGKTALIEFDASSKALPVGKLLKDLELEQRFSGVSDIDAKGKAQGVTQNELMQSMDAVIDLSGKQMQVASINIEQTVCEFIAKAERKELATKNWDDFTKLRDMTTRVIVKNGVATVQNLEAGVEDIALKTNGKFNFIKGDFDFHLNTRIVEAVLSGAGCKVTNKSLLNRDIPIRCKGNLDNMGLKTCLPDMSVLESLVKDEAKEKIKEQTDAAKLKADAEVDQAKVKANEKIDKAIKEKLGDESGKAAKDALKGLFKK